MLWYVCGFVCFGCTPATYTRNYTGTHNYSNSGQTFVNTLQSDVSVFGLTRSLYSMRFILRGSDCVRNLFTEATGFLAVALRDLYHNFKTTRHQPFTLTTYKTSSEGERPRFPACRSPEIKGSREKRKDTTLSVFF